MDARSQNPYMQILSKRLLSTSANKTDPNRTTNPIEDTATTGTHKCPPLFLMHRLRRLQRKLPGTKSAAEAFDAMIAKKMAAVKCKQADQNSIDKSQPDKNNGERKKYGSNMLSTVYSDHIPEILTKIASPKLWQVRY